MIDKGRAGYIERCTSGSWRGFDRDRPRKRIWRGRAYLMVHIGPPLRKFYTLNYSRPFLFMSRWFLACILEVPAAHADFSYAV